jgi:predicted RNA-binding protein (virulence factor B family)
MVLNKHIELGVLNTLRIDRLTEPGFYLMAEDEEVVLLPNNYITDEMQIDELIEVFIYTDSEDRIIATTLTPKAYKDEFIFAEVVDTARFGGFVDWGLPKDLFVPRNRQKTPFQIGDKRVLRVVEDEQTNRLIGVEKIKAYLKPVPRNSFKTNDEVELLIFAKTPLGYKVIVNNTYEGLIYKNEIFQKIYAGDKINGYIKKITQEGKLDISLQMIGKNNAKDVDSQKIIELLRENDMFMPYNYKSDANEIKKIFGMSKKAYKRALTNLIDSKQITLDESGITIQN